MTTDAVIVAPKPILKEPEENRDFASVTHLEFSQCQTSYVGLPGIHEASQPVPVVCSGDTSYTQLPCSVWGVSFEKQEVARAPPEDFLNISHADSGCSFAESCWWKSTMWWLQHSQQNSRRCCSCFSVQMKLPKFFIWHPARRLELKIGNYLFGWFGESSQDWYHWSQRLYSAFKEMIIIILDAHAHIQAHFMLLHFDCTFGLANACFVCFPALNSLQHL